MWGYTLTIQWYKANVDVRANNNTELKAHKLAIPCVSAACKNGTFKILNFHSILTNEMAKNILIALYDEQTMDLPAAVKFVESRTCDMIITPLINRLFHREFVDQRIAPKHLRFTRSELTLESNDWLTKVVGKLNDKVLGCDSSDTNVRKHSEASLRQELTFAQHCVSNAFTLLQLRDTNTVNLARTINSVIEGECIPISHAICGSKICFEWEFIGGVWCVQEQCWLRCRCSIQNWPYSICVRIQKRPNTFPKIRGNGGTNLGRMAATNRIFTLHSKWQPIYRQKKNCCDGWANRSKCSSFRRMFLFRMPKIIPYWRRHTNRLYHNF